MIGAKKEASGNFEKSDRSILNKDLDPYNYQICLIGIEKEVSGNFETGERIIFNKDPDPHNNLVDMFK